MYHKMPLKETNKRQTLLEKNNDHQFSLLFYGMCLMPMYLFRLTIALSSKQQFKKGKKEASYDAYPKGSVTLEMVIVLPLFVSFVVFFLFLFRVLWVQESMEEALMYASRSLAVTCYDESQKKQKMEAQLFAEAQIAFQKGLEASDCPEEFIWGNKTGISLLSSQLQGNEIILRASYQMRVPCVLIGNYNYHFTQCVQSRKWIGNRSLGQGDDGDERWVYITPYGTVYHCSRSCSYLDLKIRAVRREKLTLQRNASGKIYRCCETCGASANGVVYITDYGERYHGKLSCAGLKRTIYMVKLSQIGGRHVCSKCGVE